VEDISDKKIVVSGEGFSKKYKNFKKEGDSCRKST